MDQITNICKLFYPDIYDDPSKGVFDRARTMTVEAARIRSQLEAHVAKIMPQLREMLADKPEIVTDDHGNHNWRKCGCQSCVFYRNQMEHS